jgi:hypothetical protein
MKNENKKSSPNRIKCQISGQERMSNATYLANKGEKFDVTGNVWASFYINKESYKALELEVEAGGLDKAAELYKVDKKRVIKWLRFNGRSRARLVEPSAPKVESTSDHDRKLARRRELYAENKRQVALAA